MNQRENSKELSQFSELIIAFFEERKSDGALGIDQSYIETKREKLEGLNNLDSMKWAVNNLDSSNKERFGLKLGNKKFFEALKIVFETLEKAYT
ncbi:MAG: hypothetical protein ACYDBP_15520 [Leptospirales bacterium]